MSRVHWRTKKNKIKNDLINTVAKSVKEAFTQYYSEDKNNNVGVANKYQKQIKKLTNDNEELANSNYELENLILKYKVMITEMKDENMGDKKKVKEGLKKISESQKIIEEQEKQLCEYKHKVDYYQEILNKYKHKTETLQKEIAERNARLEENSYIIENYQLKYGNVEKVYKDYISIDEDIKQGFANMIDAKTIITFIVSGTDSDNLRLIWERISIYVEKYDKDTIEKLKNTFDVFFEMFNSVYGVYSRINTSVGDKFSVDKHSKIQGSKSSGNVEEVLLDGYMNVKTGKITKSIVRI